MTVFPLRPAKIAVKLPNRLHPGCVFADYRKAANNDGFASLWAGNGENAVQVSASGNHDKNEMVIGPRTIKPRII